MFERDVNQDDGDMYLMGSWASTWLALCVSMQDQVEAHLLSPYKYVLNSVASQPHQSN